VPTTPTTPPQALTRRRFLDRGLKLTVGLGGGMLAASLLESCGPAATTATPTPPPGSTVIRSLLFDQVGYDPAVLQQLAKKFQALHNNKVFVSIETAHYRELYDSILAAGLSRPSPYDVVALDQVWVPEFASRKQLLSLKDQIPDDSRSDLMP
jgi:ABC-type glycerol-3-phosphate transport system substrate-binding protein